MSDNLAIPGTFISLSLPGKAPTLDGFWAHGKTRQRTLTIFVHGMGGNFFRSPFKKQFLIQGPRKGTDVISIHNRGALDNVYDERFGDCLADLDAVLEFGRSKGYKRVVLVGHSTGCQKIVYYQSRRRSTLVKALVLAAPADDYGIARRDLGSRYSYWIRKAKSMVADGRGKERLPDCCNGFTARRFLSCADPAKTEASIFDYEGRLTHFRKLTLPIFAFFGRDEQFATLPVDDMGAILKAKTAADPFQYRTVDGDHGFSGAERQVVAMVFTWLKKHSLL